MHATRTSGRIHQLSTFILLLILWVVPGPRRLHAGAPAVGLWRFNEGSGTNIVDSSGFGNDGVLMGDNGVLPTWAQGQTNFGGALSFLNDGADHSYVNIPGSVSLQIGESATNAWTIVAWTYETSDGAGQFVANYGRILSQDGGNGFQFESGANGDPQYYTWDISDPAFEIGWGGNSSVAVILDQWIHRAVVYDGTNLMMYRNADGLANGGFASQPVNSPLSFAGYMGSLQIGSQLNQSADRNWNGMLDDVAVFAGALSKDELVKVMSGDFSDHIGGPASILTEPVSVTVHVGGTASFSVSAQGQEPITYFWFQNATNLVQQSTNSMLVFNVVSNSLAGTYSVIASNSLGVNPSTPFSLVVDSSATQLVGLWRFDEGNGTNAMDSSGQGNNGVLVGENGNLPFWVSSMPGFGSALYFTNDYVDRSYVNIPGTNSLMIGQSETNFWSVTAWANESSDGSGSFYAEYGRILTQDGGAGLQLESGASGDDQLYVWDQSAPLWQLGIGTDVTALPVLDAWTHWAFVYDGTTLRVYRNANEGTNAGFASIPVTAALSYAGYAGAIQIGSQLNIDASRNWNGTLDDIAVFNGVLSPAEVATVMSGDFSAYLAAPAPSLQITLNAGQAFVSWSSGSAYHLQTSSDLSSNANWANVTNALAIQGGTVSVSLPATKAAQFFRLANP